MNLGHRAGLLLACGILTPPGRAQEAYVLHELRAERFEVAHGGYFPRLVALRNGDLLATFKYGAAHVGKGGRAGLARSTDGGRTWSPPETVFDIPEADDGVDASGELSDGTLLLGAVSYTWKGDTYTPEGWKADIYTLRSHDRGRTWSAPLKVEVAPFTWAYPFGSIVQLRDGTVLLAGYGGYLPKEPHKDDYCFLLRSRDGGKSWGKPTRIAARFNEASLLVLRDGHLLAVMRSQQGGHLATALSGDGGAHWSEPVRITADGEHPGDLLRLSSGRILLTYGERNKPYGVQAMISSDEGKSWEHRERVMLAWDGDHGDLGYPVTAELRDGKLATIYYIVYGAGDPQGAKGVAPTNAHTKLVVWEPPESWRAPVR